MICIHVCAPCYQRPLGSLDWMGGLFWGSLTRAGVPLFFMCSGASYFGFFEGTSAGVCLLAAGVFALCVGATPKNGRFISYIGKASFCMYLTHIFFLDAFAYCGFSALTLPCFIAVPLVTLTVASVSAALYLVLSRIPVMKDWLI